VHIVDRVLRGAKYHQFSLEVTADANAEAVFGQFLATRQVSIPISPEFFDIPPSDCLIVSRRA
jgi:hypothetical protein